MIVRPATPADRRPLISLHRALYLTHRSSVMPNGLEPLYAYRDFAAVLEEDIDAMIANPGCAVLLAEHEENVAGYITGHIESQPRRVLNKKGIVGDWYVREELRGTGCGRALLETLQKIFREAGCQVCESATWPFNEGARRAHERLGFSEVQVTYRMLLE